MTKTKSFPKVTKNGRRVLVLLNHGDFPRNYIRNNTMRPRTGPHITIRAERNVRGGYNTDYKTSHLKMSNQTLTDTIWRLRDKGLIVSLGNEFEGYDPKGHRFSRHQFETWYGITDDGIKTLEYWSLRDKFVVGDKV